MSEIIVELLLGEKNDKVKLPSVTLGDELRFLIRVLRSGEYKHVTPFDLKKRIENSSSIVKILVRIEQNYRV